MKKFTDTYNDYKIDIVYQVYWQYSVRNKDDDWKVIESSIKEVKKTYDLTRSIKAKHVVSSPLADEVTVDPKVISKYYKPKDCYTIQDFDGYGSEADIHDYEIVNDTRVRSYQQYSYKIIKVTIRKKNKKVKGSILLDE